MIPPTLRHIATGRAVIVTLVLWLAAGFVLFQLGPYAELGNMAPSLAPLDERMGYAWTDAELYFAVLGQSGRRLYRVFLIADLGNAILMASALSLLLLFLTVRCGLERSWFWIIAFVPIAGGALDLLENTLLLIMLARFPDFSESMANAASTTTALKLMTGMVGVVAVVVGLVGWAATAARRRA